MLAGQQVSLWKVLLCLLENPGCLQDRHGWPPLNLPAFTRGKQDLQPGSTPWIVSCLPWSAQPRLHIGYLIPYLCTERSIVHAGDSGDFWNASYYLCAHYSFKLYRCFLVEFAYDVNSNPSSWHWHKHKQQKHCQNFKKCGCVVTFLLFLMHLKAMDGIFELWRI